MYNRKLALIAEILISTNTFYIKTSLSREQNLLDFRVYKFKVGIIIFSF